MQILNNTTHQSPRKNMSLLQILTFKSRFWWKRVNCHIHSSMNVGQESVQSSMLEWWFCSVVEHMPEMPNLRVRSLRLEKIKQNKIAMKLYHTEVSWVIHILGHIYTITNIRGFFWLFCCCCCYYFYLIYLFYIPFLLSSLSVLLLLPLSPPTSHPPHPQSTPPLYPLRKGQPGSHGHQKSMVYQATLKPTTFPCIQAGQGYPA